MSPFQAGIRAAETSAWASFDSHNNPEMDIFKCQVDDQWLIEHWNRLYNGLRKDHEQGTNGSDVNKTNY